MKRLTTRIQLTPRRRMALLGSAAGCLLLVAIARTVAQGAPDGAAPVGARGAAPASRDATEAAGRLELDEPALKKARDDISWIAKRRPFQAVSFDPPRPQPASPGPRTPTPTRPPSEPPPPSTPTVEVRFTGVTRSGEKAGAIFEERGRGEYLLIAEGERLGTLELSIVSSGRITLKGEEGSEPIEVAVGDRVTIDAVENLAPWASAGSSGSRSGGQASSGSSGGFRRSGRGGDRGGSEARGGEPASTGEAAAAPAPTPDPSENEALRKRMEELRARRQRLLEQRSGS